MEDQLIQKQIDKQTKRPQYSAHLTPLLNPCIQKIFWAKKLLQNESVWSGGGFFSKWDFCDGGEAYDVTPLPTAIKTKVKL